MLSCEKPSRFSGVVKEITRGVRALGTTIDTKVLNLDNETYLSFVRCTEV
jgi:hypothetical protein